MGEFRMPSLGADMTEGTLVDWLVKPGDPVHRGDIMALVDTEKAVIEAEVFEDGTVDRLLVEPGTLTAVGTPLATIRLEDGERPAREPGEAPSTADAAREPAEPPEPPVPADRAEVAGPSPAPATGSIASPLLRRLAATSGVDLEAVSGTGPGGRVTRADIEACVRPRRPRQRARSSPRARRLADQLGVDLADVHGTGPGGAISAADVQRAADRSPGAGESEEVVPAPPRDEPQVSTREDRNAAMQRTIAALMTRSNREIPHYHLVHHIDLSRARAWEAQRNRELPVARRLLTAVLLLKATALAARDHPDLNGFWRDDRFEPGRGIHLGVAIALRGGGLVAPALHDADQHSPEELMARLRDLIARARAGRLRGSEMADPTLTVSSLGEQGVEGVFGVIYPPQVALVGFGRVQERPWAEDGVVRARPVVLATLAADHRASNGHRGALFLSAVDRHLQHPEEL